MPLKARSRSLSLEGYRKGANLTPRAIFEPRGGEDGTDRVGALSPSWQVGRFAYAICYIGLICTYAYAYNEGGSYRPACMHGSCTVWTSRLSSCVCLLTFDVGALCVVLLFLRKRKEEFVISSKIEIFEQRAPHYTLYTCAV